MRGRWALVGLLAQLPGASYASAVAYRLIAAERYAMPRGTDACALPAAR